METFSRETPPLHPWFVTGFVDGEGTFTFSRNGKQLSLYFAIKLTEADRPLLEQIQQFFGGAGSLYWVKPRSAATPSSGLTKAAAYFRISRRDQLPRVLTHFDDYPLQGTKREGYEIWRAMVLLKQNFRKPPREELDELARQLSASSPRNRPWTDSRPDVPPEPPDSDDGD